MRHCDGCYIKHKNGYISEGLNAGDAGLILGSGRSPGEGHGNPTFLPRKSPWTEELGGLQSMGGSKNSRIRLSN